MWTKAAVPLCGHMTGSTPSDRGVKAQRRDIRLSRLPALMRPLIGGVIGAVLAMGGVAEAGSKIASVYCSSDFSVQTDVKRKLEDLKLFDKVDSIDMSSTAPPLATLAAYDALLIWADSSRGCSDPTGIGNVMAQYIDGGGGVVQVLPWYLGYSYSNIAGDFYTRYALVNQLGSMSYSRGATFGTKSEMHPVLDGVTSVNASGNQCYHRATLGAGDLRNGGRIVSTWADGRGMVVVGNPSNHRRVDLNMYVSSTDIGSPGCLDPKSDAYKLIGNALIWVANPLQAQPGVVDFGDVPATTTSLPQYVTVTNTGKDPITLSAGSLSPASTEFVVNISGTGMFPVTLKKDEQLALEVFAKPAAPGKRTTSYKLDTSTPGAFGIAIPLSVNGLGPKYQVDPQVINFGGLPVGSMPRTQIVTISNAGGGLLTLRSAPTISDTTNFTLVGLPSIPTSLYSGGFVSFEVKFNPMMERVHTATLSIYYNDGADRTATININGSYGKPKIGVPTGTIVMTPVRVNLKGPEMPLTITNSGLADLTVSAATFTGANAGEFSVLNAISMGTPLVVKPNGGTETLRLQCNPTVTGLRQATLNITSDDPMTGMATVNLNCNGVVANFAHTPDKIDFTPAQQTGQCSAATEVVIKNSGTDALRVLSVAFMGPNAASFSQPITGGRFVAANNGELRIPVKFCPKDIGMQTADLVITTDYSVGHVAKVPLTGIATGPKIVAKPGNIDFGPIYLKATSPTQIIELTNEGDQPLIFGKSTLTPAAAMGPFKVVAFPAEGTSLKKGDAPVKLEVNVTPTMAQQYTGEIAIGVNDLVQGGTLKIPLSAIGTQAEITVSPMMITFPQTIAGLRSQPTPVTVSNTGKAPLTGLDVKIIGMHYNDFGFDSSKVPMMPVPAGQNFQIPVDFRPQAAGARNAILVVNAAGLMAPVQIKLDGTAKSLTLACSPDEKNFGTVPAGQTKTEKITCRNSDGSDIEYVAAVTDFVDEWQIEAAKGTIPAAQGGEDGLLTLQVTFAPMGQGERTTSLMLRTKDGLQLAQISLDGKGGVMPKDKTMPMQGCAYGGSPRSGRGLGALFALLLASGLLVLRRRRAAL